jgi:hypothetical protein
MKKTYDSKLWEVFSIYIRLRDADENGICKCFTCSARKHWKMMQAGHGIPRQHWGTRYLEKNVHAQCRKCNFFEQGKQSEYALQVDAKYGAGTWDSLTVLSKQKRKRLSDVEIKALREHYLAQIEILKKEKNCD